uniref:Uncharacterized protein AlNc14C555G12148 n=1 Tax=Albugo laibachii Nc14 TaxID=890382 RepID=F0X155_9STRA|nr:conserved hypothetical protein [Albugo laibachii Nc14]|eukprot:CCA27511.1 conserved hypothetical protein [Albugo laibachii Nc14]
MKTLPAPNAPVISQVKRTSVTIAWHDVHRPDRYNTRAFGYFVCWKGNQDHTIHRRSIPIRALDRNVAGTLQTKITALKPNHTYTFSLGIYVENTFGPGSRPSQARTLPFREPNRIRGAPLPFQKSQELHLRWLNPVDNGGAAIQAFWIAIHDVYGASFLINRIDVISASRTLYNNSLWLETSVDNLIPRRLYQFRISATNAFGPSAWSDLSQSFQSLTHCDLVRGIPITRLRTHHTCSFILSDRAETLAKVSSQQFTYGWRGHFSPKSFDVIGEMIASEPLNASTPLQNSQDVYGRIVILHRDQTSFLDKVWHAQQAGALGVVIIDTGGVCRGTFDGNCVFGSSKALGNGFGHTDGHDRWYEIRIPYILITKAAAASLLPGCDLQKFI